MYFINFPPLIFTSMLFLLLLMAIFSTLSQAQTLIGPVQTQYGLVRGIPGQQNGSITRFLGIPFAASTAGTARWRPSQPATNWSGIFNATTYGPICIQFQRMSSFTMSEDCLNLNIWTGAKNSSEGRPVYVWIYGGRFSAGSNRESLYDGEGFAQKGLVVVNFNYRTGVLGFLAHPLLSQESGRGSGNYGLMDQIAALQWIKQNIGAFGGDPAKVTIGGQSAGAASVLHLVNSPLAKGLFRAAVLESGARYPRDPEISGLATSYRTREKAEAQGIAYLQQLNISSIDQLRAMNVDAITVGNNVNDNDVYGNPPLYRPVLDGHVIQHGYLLTYHVRRETYNDYLVLGLHNDVPIMTGNNKDESGALPNPQLSVQKYTELAMAKYNANGANVSQEFLQHYPASTDAQADESSNQAFRDNSLVGTFLWAQLWSTRAKSPTWNYYWTHAPPADWIHSTPGQGQGAFHMTEINYFFNNFYGTNSSWTQMDYNIGNVLSSYLVNFVTNLDPNGPGLQNWPKASNAEETMLFGNGVYEANYPIASQPHIQFFKRYFALQPAF